MSAWTYRPLTARPPRKAAPKIVPPRPRIPYWNGLGADSEEKHEPVSDIDTAVVDSLKALDPKRPIREADMPVRAALTMMLRAGSTPSYASPNARQSAAFHTANTSLPVSKPSYPG